MTFYVKVTWPWAWPFLTLILVTLEQLLSFFVSQVFGGRGCQININPHCNYEVLPWSSSSRDHESDFSYHVTLTHLGYKLNYVHFRPLPQEKNQWNKKDHSSSFTGTGDKKSHVHGHLTLTYKVTRDSCCVELYICDIPDHEKPAKQKRSSFLRH